mmetsp:Transcript_22848/g.70911  ORF Transcript_22848/g.70911 Transcript_22848/m.70911 type:complete len:301 (+) Transcript_22848:445-1347(+)
MSHLGRPKGQRKPEMSLAPVADRLRELLGENAEVAFVEDCVGDDVTAAVGALTPGSVLVLQNLRYHAAEEKNEEVGPCPKPGAPRLEPEPQTLMLLRKPEGLRYPARVARGRVRERRLRHGAPRARVHGGRADDPRRRLLRHGQAHGEGARLPAPRRGGAAARGHHRRRQGEQQAPRDHGARGEGEHPGARRRPRLHVPQGPGQGRGRLARGGRFDRHRLGHHHQGRGARRDADRAHGRHRRRGIQGGCGERGHLLRRRRRHPRGLDGPRRGAGHRRGHCRHARHRQDHHLERPPRRLRI